MFYWLVTSKKCVKCQCKKNVRKSVNDIYNFVECYQKHALFVGCVVLEEGGIFEPKFTENWESSQVVNGCPIIDPGGSQVQAPQLTESNLVKINEI